MWFMPQNKAGTAGRTKTREWTTRQQVAGVENAGVRDSGK